MKYVKDIADYKSKSGRIEGWRPLIKFGLKIPDPVKIVTHAGFIFFQKNGLTGQLKKEVTQSFVEIRKQNPSRGVYAGRGYYVPGFDAPPGPRSSSIKTKTAIVKEVQKLFEFAIKSKFNKPGAEINVIMHPFINPVLPMSGGCITPSNANPNELVVEAIYGNDEGVQSFYHDTFHIDVNKMVITDKVIQNKPECLQTTENFEYKTVKVPKRYQDEQCINDLTVLMAIQQFKEVVKKAGPHRVEFIVQEDGIYFRDLTPFKFPKEQNLKFTETKATVVRVSEISDLDKLKKNGKAIYIDKSVIQNRNMDLLTSIALSFNRKIIVLYPGTATTAHAVTILREKGHMVVYVGRESFKTDDRVRIYKKGKEIIADKIFAKDVLYISPHNKNSKVQKKLVGGKAARLDELKQWGFNVPKYFTVTTEAFDYYMHENSLEVEIENLPSRPSSSLLQEKIKKNSLPNDLETSILKNFKLLKVQKVAVRSSANVEDGTKASFSGQFETFLNIKQKDLITSIKDCWVSTFNNSAVMYAVSQKIPVYKMKMAVLVMQMVDAKKAGVIFTKDLNENDNNSIIIEATEGLGDKLVDGLVEPNKIIIDKKQNKILSNTGKKTLTPVEVKKLTNVALKIENKYKSPQDIEWAIDKSGKLYVLQTRPITT